jgi:hypothetical protein
MAGLLGEQGQDHEAKVAVLQEAANAAATMAPVKTRLAFAHAAAPGVAAAVFVPAAVKMMVSVHR